MSNQLTPKYSILIPTYNGVNYLPACVNTIIEQNFSNFELLISNDNSTDSTDKYLNSLSHPNIVILNPPESMSMAEHWEWLLAHAKGEWIMFVGQDDGVQPYFFELSEKLTQIATQKKLRTIASKRAYYFWPGCEDRYGDIAIQYTAFSKIRILNFRLHTLLALLGLKTYFDLPQMYTTSMFHRSIIEDAKKMQNEKVFITHPQDANLAAIGCSLEKSFLWSEVPLGWVGSSPKSAGMAIRPKNKIDNGNEINSLKEDYISKVKNSKLICHPLVGDFELGSLSIYFWGALLQIKHLTSSRFSNLISSKIFKTFLFGSVLLNPDFSNTHLLKLFKRVVELNKCNMFLVSFVSKLLYPIKIAYKIINKIDNWILKITSRAFSYSKSWGEEEDLSMKKSSEYVINGVRQNNILLKIFAK